MQRRQALQSIALAFGGALSIPTLMALKTAQSAPVAPGFTLADEQRAVLQAVSEQIIPRTNTPGAMDAGVPDFVEMMIRDCYKKPEQESFQQGLQKLQTAGFASLSPNEQIRLLKQVEKDADEELRQYQIQQTKIGDNEDQETVRVQVKGLPFWRLVKELTLLGYYTSEKGVKASFDYVPVPGKLELITLKPGQKSFAY